MMINPVSGDIEQDNGKILTGAKIREIKKFILSKFSEEKLSAAEAMLILGRVKEDIDEYAIITMERE